MPRLPPRDGPTRKPSRIEPMPGPVITISGPHGTGKSTYAKALAEALGLRYIAAGDIFRDIARQQNLSLGDLSDRAAQDPKLDKMLDERTKAEAKRGGVVIDAQLGAWMAGNLVDVKMLLTAPDDVRFKRIADREGVSVDEARRETQYREAVQQKRYKEYYGIDVSDLSIYDTRIDTGLNSIDETKKIVIEAVRDLLKRRGKLNPPG